MTTTTTKLANRFIAFDHQNPRVWDLFVRFTHEAIRANHSTFWAQSIIERHPERAGGAAWRAGRTAGGDAGDGSRVRGRGARDHVPERDGARRLQAAQGGARRARARRRGGGGGARRVPGRDLGDARPVAPETPRAGAKDAQ